MARPRRSTPRRDGPMPEMTRIGQALAERRLALRLTQQELADLAGLSRYVVQSLERGSGSTKIASVLEIANVLGLHVSVSAAE